MIKKILPLLILGVLALGAADAQTVTIPEAGVTPDSPLWRLDVGIDNIRARMGGEDVKMEVAHERLAEAKQMSEGNRSEEMNRAMERANARMRQVPDDHEGLQVARQQINSIKETAPEEAQEGLDTALESISQEKQQTGQIQTPA